MSFEDPRPRGRAANERLADEIELPPQLAALAEQLSDDAVSLSRCFPAGDRPRFAAIETAFSTASRPRHKYMRWSVVAGGCAATVLAVVLGWQAAVRFGRDAGAITTVNDGAEQPSQVAQLNDTDGYGRQTNGEAIGRLQNVLEGFSGAEQEAVLDLLESHTAPKTSLSI